jgi:hypothetical protein
MSPRERRLRERIDTLRDERDKAKADAKRAKRTVRRLPSGPYAKPCVYCGMLVPATARVPVCHGHSDLPALDPSYVCA